MIATVVLAAGSAKRFGSQKLVAPLGGRAVVRAAVECAVAAVAAEVGETVVVTGADAPAVQAVLAGLPVRFVTNAVHETGMGSSLGVGIGSLAPAVRAALVVLGDQPFVPLEAYAAVLAAYAARGAAIVAPRYNGVHGHPVLFDATVFPELRSIRGDRGAREVIARDRSRVEFVDLLLPPPADVDEPAELAALAARLL